MVHSTRQNICAALEAPPPSIWNAQKQCIDQNYLSEFDDVGAAYRRDIVISIAAVDCPIADPQYGAF